MVSREGRTRGCRIRIVRETPAEQLPDPAGPAADSRHHRAAAQPGMPGQRRGLHVRAGHRRRRRVPEQLPAPLHRARRQPGPQPGRRLPRAGPHAPAAARRADLPPGPRREHPKRVRRPARRTARSVGHARAHPSHGPPDRSPGAASSPRRHRAPRRSAVRRHLHRRRHHRPARPRVTALPAPTELPAAHPTAHHLAFHRWVVRCSTSLAAARRRASTTSTCTSSANPIVPSARPTTGAPSVVDVDVGLTIPNGPTTSSRVGYGRSPCPMPCPASSPRR